MIIDDFHIVGIAPEPAEADAPLVIDADAVLADAVAMEPLEAIPRGDSEVLKAHRSVQYPQLAESGALHVRAELPDRLAVKEPFGVLIPEALDHDKMITRNVININMGLSE